jgi:hypothetical protein
VTADHATANTAQHAPAEQPTEADLLAQLYDAKARLMRLVPYSLEAVEARAQVGELTARIRRLQWRREG